MSEQSTRERSEGIIVGKDILELLSSAMYVDPLTIYREFVQNATDSIDEGEIQGFYSEKYPPRIDILLNHDTQSVRIRDNGPGIARNWVLRRLMAIGASKKRGTGARGFRGVGRLSGLAYCQELVFRTKTVGDPNAYEMRWDCQKLKDLLFERDLETELSSVLEKIISINSISSDLYPEHFFEVELCRIFQHKVHLLLNEEVIGKYLCQVAPVPFSTKFKLGTEIQRFLEKYDTGKSYSIFIHNAQYPLTRPFRAEFEAKRGIKNVTTELHTFDIPGITDGTDAIGWILHHDYRGALPCSLGVSGLRARIGNMQIGDSSTLHTIFREPRFNSWAIGEVHVLNPKIIPNGRRDDFEQNAQYGNLIKHLKPKAAEIVSKCRKSSAQRTSEKQKNKLKFEDFDWGAAMAFIKGNGKKKLSPARKRELKKFVGKDGITYIDLCSFVLGIAKNNTSV